MIIDVYTFCWNEEIRLPYFLRLWGPIARRIIIYDNGSTDKSRKIALKYPNVVWDTVTYGQNEINDIKYVILKTIAGNKIEMLTCVLWVTWMNLHIIHREL